MPAPIRAVDKDGFPIPPTFDDPAPQSSAPRKRGGLGSSIWKWALLLLFPVLLFGKKAVDLAWDFVANLQFQQAQHEFEAGEQDDALEHVNRAIDWEPESLRRWESYKLRAEIFSKKGLLQQAVDDCDLALKYAPPPEDRLPRGPKQKIAYQAMPIYSVRAMALYRLGRPADALADCTTAIDSCATPLRRYMANFYNLRAYIAALSGIELKQADEDIATAMQIEGEVPELIDTRACIRLKQGRLQEALDDMNTAIGSEENRRPFGLLPVEQRELDREIAVMYHHRSQIFEKIGQREKADGDAQLAAAHGYDPKDGE